MDNWWDTITQWFTPPKGKTPWTAMTEGSTDKWAKGAEQWGPLINSYINAVVPGSGFIGGMIGMEGRGTGFQGTDYGYGNFLPVVSGISKGFQSNPINGVIQGAGGYWNKGNNPIGGYNTTYDRSQDPYGKEVLGQNWMQSLTALASDYKSIGNNGKSNIDYRTKMPKTTQAYIAG